MRCDGTPWPPVNDYLADLEGRLGRWRWSRRAVLAELADGLTDAVEHDRACGIPTSEAVDRALRDSGPAVVVAGAIAETLSVAAARRTAVTLLLTGPVAGVLWLRFLVPGQPPAVLLAGQPILTVLIMISAGCAASTVLAARRRCRPGRWTPAQIAATACAAAVLGDALLLALGLATLAADRMPVAAAALAASLLRLSLSQRVARRDLIRRPVVR